MLEMSRYELEDLFVSWVSQNQQISLTFLSVLTGYLLIAHFIGSRLSKSQVLIVTTIYIVYAIAQIGGLYGQMEVLVTLSEASPDNLGNSSPATIEAWGSAWCAIQSSMLGASLYFMWSVRRPNSK